MKLQYLRKKHNFLSPKKHIPQTFSEVRGVMIATKVDGKIHFGWSKVSKEPDVETHMPDKFVKPFGIQLAEKRLQNVVVYASLPVIVKEHVEAFLDSATRYFKDAAPVVLVK